MEQARSGRSALAASRNSTLAAVALAVAGAFMCGTPVKAQVLELRGGGVVTYDGPAVFDGNGSAPIILPRGRLAKRAAAHPSMIVEAARATEVGEDLIAAVAWSESRMQARAVSRAGARGEMQLMPATARALGVDPADSAQNYRGGASYLHRLLIRYDGDLVKSLAAYNAGPGAVDRYHGVPPFRETQAYIAAVLERLSRAAEGG